MAKKPPVKKKVPAPKNAGLKLETRGQVKDTYHRNTSGVLSKDKKADRVLRAMDAVGTDYKRRSAIMSGKTVKGVDPRVAAAHRRSYSGKKK